LKIRIYPQINNNRYNNRNRHYKIFYQTISTKSHQKSIKYLIKLPFIISFIIVNISTLSFKFLSNIRINYSNINNSTLNKISNNTTSVCLCTLAKLENKYIREFVNHYKNYGVDKIYLYDNNDINGEKFD